MASDLSPILQQITFAEQSLLKQRSENSGSAATGESMGVVFTGDFQHVVPNHLLFNKLMQTTDKIFWMIMRGSITNPRMPGYIPSREELCEAMNCSAPTVAKARAALRITRWMTFSRSVKDDQHRFVGDVYLLHDEPLNLADTLKIDAGYVSFLEAQVSGASTSKANRQLAAQVLHEITSLVSTPRSPTQVEMVEDRLREAIHGEPRATYTEADEGRVKNLYTAPSDANPSALIDIEQSPGNSRPSDDHESTHGKNFNAALEGHGKNLYTAFDENLDSEEKSLHGPDDKKNFSDPRSICSSSININKYINTRAHEEAQLAAVEKLNPSPTFETTTAACLADCHLGFLATEMTAPKLFLWDYYRPNLQVLGRILLKQPSAIRNDVCYQLFGRLIFNNQYPGTECIKNIVGFTHTLVKHRENDTMMLDEMGQMVKEAIENHEPHFIDFGGEA